MKAKEHPLSTFLSASLTAADKRSILSSLCQPLYYQNVPKNCFPPPALPPQPHPFHFLTSLFSSPFLLPDLKVSSHPFPYYFIFPSIPSFFHSPLSFLSPLHLPFITSASLHTIPFLLLLLFHPLPFPFCLPSLPSFSLLWPSSHKLAYNGLRLLIKSLNWSFRRCDRLSPDSHHKGARRPWGPVCFYCVYRHATHATLIPASTPSASWGMPRKS